MLSQVLSEFSSSEKVHGLRNFYFYCMDITSTVNKCSGKEKWKRKSCIIYSRLPIIRTFKVNRKKFELSGIRVIKGKIYRKRSDGKWKLLRVSETVRVIEGSSYRESTDCGTGSQIRLISRKLFDARNRMCWLSNLNRNLLKSCWACRFSLPVWVNKVWLP